MGTRIMEHPILGEPKKGKLVHFTYDGQKLQGYEGEPIAAALKAAGIMIHRYTKKEHTPRGIFCAIGRCTDCVMVVDGVPNVRTCVTIVEVDNHFQFIPGTEKQFDVDTICLAVGLSPMSQLLKMAGCEMEDNPKRGGQKTGRCILHRGRSGGIKEDQRKDSPGCDCKTCI